MSFNQSRSDKSETQYRKSGRSLSSNHQRGSSGAYGKGSGVPAPSPSISSNRSFKKSNNNAQGGQSRASVPAVNSSDSNASIPRGALNGAHLHPQLHGASDAPVTSSAAKQTEPLVSQKSSRGVPKAPTSQHAPMSSATTATTTPTKPTGDASKGFAFQFGSLSPGFVNGMQIPARTSSAPPNLDEQKRDQARHESFRAVPTFPIPSGPKQQLPRKDPGVVEKPKTPEAHPVPKVKQDVQVSHAPPSGQTQKPSGLPMTGMSMPIPFHQSPVSIPFGGPNQQIQSQGVTANSLQMPIPMPLSIGSAPPVQQPVFVSGLQPHPLQHQGIMHQGQNLSFTTQMTQLGPQLGNLGIGMAPQYPQQQGGKFGVPPRKTTVKIINPKTHEEVRFDKRPDGHSDGGSSVMRPHPNVPQSQPIPSFPASHPMNYYPAPYNTNNLYFQTPSSLPLTSGQMAPNTQAARFSYPSSQGPQSVTIVNPSALNSVSVNKSGPQMHGILEPPNVEHAHDVQSSVSSVLSGTTHVTVKPTTGSVGEKVESLSNNSLVVDKGELSKPSGPSGEASLSHSSADAEICTDSSSQKSKSVGDSMTMVAESVVVTDPPADTVAAVSVEAQVSTSSPSSSAVPSDSVLVLASAESRRKETLSRSNSMKDQQKKPVKKGLSQSQHQVGGQSIPISSSPSETLEQGLSSVSVASESVESNTSITQVIDIDVLEAAEESLSATRVATSDASVAVVKVESIADSSQSISSEISHAGTGPNALGSVHLMRLDGSSAQDRPLKDDFVVTEEQGGKRVSEGSKQDAESSEVSSEVKSLQSVEFDIQSGKEIVQDAAAASSVVTPVDTARGTDEPGICYSEHDAVGDKDVEGTSEKSSDMDATLSGGDNTINDDVSVSKSEKLLQQSTQSLAVDTSKHEGGSLESVGGGGSMENLGGAGVSVPTGSKDKFLPELTRSKSTVVRGKKKKKEYLQKADAAGTTSDLYIAYKGPEEKKETDVAIEVTESTSRSVNSKQVLLDVPVEEVPVIEKDVGSKAEPDDWEDAADISKPKLETSDNGTQANGGVMYHDKDGNGNVVKKYSRDFLLKFADQFTDFPEDFEITADISEVLMSPNVNTSHLVDRNSFHSPGRIIDRPGGGPRLDRRNSGITEDDRWSKLPSPFGPGRDLHLDLGFGPSSGFRPGQGPNFGVLRNPRVQTPVQYAGGILSGPMQSLGSQAGMQRNSPDADRWQRAASFQHKGLIPSPQTPLLMMHKTEKRYEVGKVADEEEAKQRQLKGILNKLTPQNFEKLFEQVKAVNIDNAGTLRSVIGQIFDKALMEPTFCEMYANFCYHLSGELPDFSEDGVKITFKRLLLNKCQEEFERGEREQAEANKADEEGEVKQSDEEREEKRIKARRRMLGNIRLIGELYKKKMLTERIMHECIKKLLGQHQTPDEEDVEALCKLMSTIGEIIDHPKAKEHMDVYFEGMKNLSNNMRLSSRVRFMLKDAIDLRKNKWQQRRKVEGPKKIEEVHRDAAQERQAQTSRLARGPSMNASGRRGPAMDFGPRGSAMLSSPSSQMGSFRTMPTQVRGFGSQDVRQEERQPFEARTLRAVGDDAITLGPQGGLARGMSIRGPPSMSSAVLAADLSLGTGDSRRATAGLNGYSSVSDRTYGPREDLLPRIMPDRFAGQAAYDHLGPHDRNINHGGRDLRNSDHTFDRSNPISPPARGHAPTTSQNAPTETVWPEEHLREKSKTAIKEFYSARDEKEVALCIKELNAPSFHPTMVSIWVTDSFEGKDMERDLLGKLLVNLAKSGDAALSRTHLVKGFEAVLESLEDTVTDAPKAPEYLGRMFAKMITEDVVSMGDIGWLIREGGEEPGSLRSSGLAADVLGNILELIKSEKGESVLNEIVTSSNLRLDSFRPPDPLRSRILEKFI